MRYAIYTKGSRYIEKVVTSVNAEMPGVVKQIILYGSYARGDYSPESDLDIML